MQLATISKDFRKKFRADMGIIVCNQIFTSSGNNPCFIELFTKYVKGVSCIHFFFTKAGISYPGAELVIEEITENIFFSYIRYNNTSYITAINSTVYIASKQSTN